MMMLLQRNGGLNATAATSQSVFRHVARTVAAQSGGRPAPFIRHSCQLHRAFTSTAHPSSPLTRSHVGSTWRSPPVSSRSGPLGWKATTFTERHNLRQARSFSSHQEPCTSLFHRARRRATFQEPSKRFMSNKTTPRNETRPARPAESPDAGTSGKHPIEESHGSPRGYLDRLPDLSNRFQRPTKEELLAAATGFWARLRVRFKWFSIRSVRPWNMDDISAFATWVVAGHIIWILVGTTTFFSLLIFAVNTVFAQETLAGWVGNYLTKSSGVRVVFESAIVPKWKDGVITFKNVFVSRRPGLQKKKKAVSKGSQLSAAAAAAAVGDKSGESIFVDEEEDTNYTQFDVSIDTVNVTLSFAKWFNGHGLLRDVEIKGIRGVVDRTSVHWSGEYVDPRSYKHKHDTGDFEIESFKMEDLLVSVHQPGGFRPFSVSIFSADLPQLRKQWLFYDFLSATNMSGSFDDSPFFIHPRQMHNYTGASLHQEAPDAGDPGNPAHWKKQSRVRVDGLNIDHLNRGVEGPFSWIQSGNVDIVADVMFPVDNDESIAKVVSDFYDRVEAQVTANRQISSTPSATTNKPHDTPGPESFAAAALNNPPATDAPESKYLVMDLRVHLHPQHAAVPLFTHDLSYVNNALIRPIVAFINSKKDTFIPINCRVVKPSAEFDGSWTIYDSGLMEDLSRETYEAFARDVADDQARMRRIRKVGVWTLQLAVQALVLGLAGNMA